MNEPSFLSPNSFRLLLLVLVGCAPALGGGPVADAGADTQTLDASMEPRADADVDAIVAADVGVEVDADDAEPPPPGRVRHVELGGGARETLVDARSTSVWVAIDLDAAGRELDVDVLADTRWDVALQRYHFRTNGGAGGPAEVRVTALDDVRFDDVVRGPRAGDGDPHDALGWRRDEPPRESDIPGEVPMGDGVPWTVISNEEDPWYLYDGATHALTPKARVYFVESTEGRLFALEVVDYYSPTTGSAGHPAFRWKELTDR